MADQKIGLLSPPKSRQAADMLYALGAAVDRGEIVGVAVVGLWAGPGDHYAIWLSDDVRRRSTLLRGVLANFDDQLAGLIHGGS